MGRALFTRVRRVEKRLGEVCHACAGRDRLALYFQFDGCLRDGVGRPVDDSVLEPCRVCGKDTRHGVKVIAGVDPKFL